MDSILIKLKSVDDSWLARTQSELKIFKPLFSMAPILKSSTATIM